MDERNCKELVDDDDEGWSAVSSVDYSVSDYQSEEGKLSWRNDPCYK
jgi:hypothetical protein